MEGLRLGGKQNMGRRTERTWALLPADGRTVLAAVCMLLHA